MTNVELAPLACTKCGSPLDAGEGKLAWVCAQCGQGLLLGADGLTPIAASFGGPVAPGAQGRPYWVAAGQVTIQSREAFEQVALLGMGNQGNPAHALWDAPRTFYFRADTCTPADLITLGSQMVQNPPQVQPGAAVPFLPVVLPPSDLQPLAEAIVMNIEFERKDHLKEFLFTLRLEPASLLILPG